MVVSHEVEADDFPEITKATFVRYGGTVEAKTYSIQFHFEPKEPFDPLVASVTVKKDEWYRMAQAFGLDLTMPDSDNFPYDPTKEFEA